MPIPSSINDLSTAAGSNSPAGSESPSLIDDYLRTYASYIALLRDGAQSNGFNYAAAGGTANAITATYSPAITTLSDSTVLLVKASLLNTGATTFSPNGLAAKPVVTIAHAPLQGGEIVANGELCLQYNTSVSGGSWVLIYSSGSVLQATTPIQSLTASVAANALTVAWAPAPLVFRNATATVGTPVVANIAAGLSIVVPASATLGTTSALQATLVFLVAYNAGTPVLCVTNLGGGADLSETGFISPTTISAASTSAGVIYSASAVAAGSPYRVVGSIQITEATAGAWATAPTLVQGSGGQALTALSSIGFGQAWQDVTGSRVLGTVYANTTGRPITLNVTMSITAAAGASVVVMNGLSVNGNPNSGVNAFSAITVIVPAGATYRASCSAGTPTLSQWLELR
ncbi:hypothetical protein [Pseudomonas sp.]|uniref:hypothetical protein n=1 Tax=Pseudomonas sp. TaxID=306 RepID=UPI003F38E293